MYSNQRSQAFDLATTTERLHVGGGCKHMEKEQACKVTRLHSRAGQQLGIYFRRDNYLGDLTVKRLLYGINVPVHSLEQVLIFSNWKRRSLR